MNIMGVILPVAAVLIAGLLVAALWLWWGGGTPEHEDVTESHSSPEAMTTPLTDASIASILPKGFRVMASSQTGKMAIQIGGTIYSRLTEIPDTTLRNEIRRQIEALQQFIGEDQPLRSSPTIAPAKAVPTLPEKPVIQAASTMADQIEAILQEHLLTLPHMHSRSIHILNSRDGGAQIKVDDTYYDSVNDVQDDEIKAVLQTAIQEWEIQSRLI